MTSGLQSERLDLLLDRLAKDEPLPLDLDQKKDEPRPLDLDQENDLLSGQRWLSSKRWIKRPSLGRRSSRALIPYLITSSYLIPFCIGVAVTMAWQRYGTPSTDPELAAVRQSVDQLSAKVEQMAEDIAAQQAVLRKVSAPPPAPRRAN